MEIFRRISKLTIPFNQEKYDEALEQLWNQKMQERAKYNLSMENSN